MSTGNVHVYAEDTLAEWSRRRPAKPMGSPRVGSNPTGVVFMAFMVFDKCFFAKNKSRAFTNVCQGLAVIKQAQVLCTSGVAQWLACWAHNPKVPGSKPGSAIEMLRSHLCCKIFIPIAGVRLKSTPCGTRTHNLRIRSPTPCPLGQGGCHLETSFDNLRLM